jgi:hypothetical protein
MRNTTFSRIWFGPVLAQILTSRLELFLIVVFGLLQAGLAYAHLPGWPCPILAATGVPCPGCGLSRASSELLHGHWQASLQTHAFAPFFMAALGFMALVLILPADRRERITAWVAQIERKTGVTAWFLTGLMLYWGLRLIRVL